MSPEQARWIFIAAQTCLLPLLPHLPDWLGALTLLTSLWCGVLLWQHVKLPPRWLLTTVAIGEAGAVALHFHTLFGLKAGSAFLCLLFSLKLLEMRSVRDGFTLVLLGYFVGLVQFFHTQSIGSAVLTLAGAVATTAALIVLNQPGSTRLHTSHAAHASSASLALHDALPTLRLASVMLLQATPFMLLLFLLFPRIQGPLWGLPADAFSNVTGLSDTMSPGTISQLSRSDAIAFRARFTGEYEGKSPPQKTLYWRGPVLAIFDGRTWKASPSGIANGIPYETTGKPVGYTVTLEPHNKSWLFALELPGNIPPDGMMLNDYQLLARSPVRMRLRYDMKSSDTVSAGRQESLALLNESMQLPADANPRSRALAATWRSELGYDVPALVGRMLDHFREQDFYYTLSPPLLGEHSVDEFLFDSRRGFCEHYAAAFVFMMRAAGIPARVVTGYQGGEINPIDGTLVVRQSDAHAWAEVWSKARGWQRIDPTAAIAPSRIEKNLAEALPTGEPLPLLARPQFSWLHQMRFRWDALANAWNQWVIGYNPQRQRDLLARLGIRSADWQQMTALFTGLCGLLLLGFTAWALRQRQRVDPALALWNRLSEKLGKIGLARQSWEGPLDYARRIADALPSGSATIAGEIRDIAALYVHLRYAARTTQTAAQTVRLLDEMKRRIARLKV